MRAQRLCLVLGGARPWALQHVVRVPLSSHTCSGTHCLLRPACYRAAEVLGEERFAHAADVVGPSGWSPRRVAVETSNAALLAALPPGPQLEPAIVPSTAQESEAGSSVQEEGSEHLLASQKLRALEDDWPSSYAPPTKQPPVAAAAAAHSKVHSAASVGSKVSQREQPPPSHDATLLASLLREMHVPPEPGTAGMASNGSGSGSGGSKHSSWGAEVCYRAVVCRAVHALHLGLICQFPLCHPCSTAAQPSPAPCHLLCLPAPQCFRSGSTMSSRAPR